MAWTAMDYLVVFVLSVTIAFLGLVLIVWIVEWVKERRERGE